MKKGGVTIYLAMAIMCLAQIGYSQGILAPLYVFTNGCGSITPYQSGQLLEVGQTYELTATPDAGYEFSSWQPVNVLVTTQTNYDAEGDPILPPLVSVVPSAADTNIYGADLEFTMQDVVDVTPQDNNPNMIEAFGWQADFVPVPEPADTALIASGLLAMAVARRRWRL